MFRTSQGPETPALFSKRLDMLPQATSIEVDLSEFQSAMLLLPERLDRAIRKQLKQEIQEVVRVARRPSRHRYITRTGSLERSVLSEVSPDASYAKAYLESGIASYGVFVHEGHGGPGKSVLNGYPYVWDPDQFLYESLEIQRTEIEDHMEMAVREAIGESGF